MCTRDVKQNQYGYQNPSQQDMQYEDLYITTADKVKLHGWLIKQIDSKNRPTIIYFHENAGSKYLYFKKINSSLLLNKITNYFLVKMKSK